MFLVAVGLPSGMPLVVDGVIYVTTAWSKVYAFDAKTGKLLWEVPTGDYRTGAGHNHPPLVADGKVFIGHAGGDRDAGRCP